ncbi:MAG: radical SAM protein, partial [Rhodothermales bacterium]|nr:radical SAM protein [Rhodothermales bacterium]
MSANATIVNDLLNRRPDTDAVKSFLKRAFPKGRIDRVLFVNPPDGDASLFRVPTALRRRYPNYPPYGPAVLAQHLRAIGVEPRILNLNDELLKACHAAPASDEFDFDAIWRSHLKAAVEEFTPDFIGITCMFTMTHPSLKKVCEYAARFGVPVVIGGVHVTNDVDRVLDDIPQASIAFLQESDVAIKNFCRVVAGDMEISDLAQVILVDGDERHKFTNLCRPSAEEMDVVPAYDLFDVSNLSRYGVIGNFHGFKSRETRFATVLSNRGCRAQCTFCSVRNFNGIKVRQRSVESVLDELELLEKEHGIGHIVWLDDDLLKDHKRALDLFNGMVRRGLKLTWDATNGLIASSCKDEIVHAMADSGCIAINIGMESGNPEILKQIKKPGTVKTFLAAAEVFRRYPQIHARVFLMIGFPGETLRMINDTINVAREMDMDWCGITPLQPLPNTPIYDSMVEQGLISEEERSEVRFMAGGYGKQDEIDLGIRMATDGFEEAFRSIPMDSVPSKLQITDIWLY